MCGINGIVDSTKSIDDLNTIVNKMAYSTSHRGPDNVGVYTNSSIALAHNRLSIIDLSSASNQPLIKKGLVIIFNGEIYNYKELRAQLEKDGISFSTESDTEVIIESYVKYGENCVEKFLGMWSFAIYNEQTKELFCSRDRFGIKPFYYIFQNEKFYFSSEVKALKYSPLFSNDININHISRAFQLGWLYYKDETFFKCVNTLEAGKNLVFKDGQLRIYSYWDINKTNNKITKSDSEIVSEFKNIFDSTLDIHLRSDVPLGVTLSGGIDSSSIISSILYRKLVPSIKSFSVYYEGKNDVDERPFINEIFQKYPNQVDAYFVSPNTEEVFESFDKITYHNDFPLMGSSPISQYFVMKQVAKSNIKVLLSGQGADDYLGGYMHSYYRLYADYLRKLQVKTAFKEFKYHVKHQTLGLGKSCDVALKSILSLFFSEEQLYNFEYNNYYPKAVNFKHSKISLDSVNSYSFDNFHYNLLKTTSLPSLLHYEDRNSMAFSLESRVPFLDHRLVELSFQLPTKFKINNGWTKWILREAMENRLPEKIKYRTDKKGFVTPGEIKWLRGELKQLLEIDYTSLDFLDKTVIKKEINDFKNGKNKNANFIWRVANMNYWLKNI